MHANQTANTADDNLATKTVSANKEAKPLNRNTRKAGVSASSKRLMVRNRSIGARVLERCRKAVTTAENPANPMENSTMSPKASYPTSAAPNTKLSGAR